jgi:hypothetical protein
MAIWEVLLGVKLTPFCLEAVNLTMVDDDVSGLENVHAIQASAGGRAESINVQAAEYNHVVNTGGDYDAIGA